MTDRIAMIGHPVAGVKSPALFNARFASLGMAMRVETVDVPPERLAAYLQAFRDDPALVGVISTTPHKVALAQFADRLGPSAHRLGLANALRRRADGTIEGEMFDGHAFRACMAAAGISLYGKTVGVIGFGAAGRACALAAEELGASCIFASDTDPVAQERIAQLGYRSWAPGIERPETKHLFDLVVNAAPKPLDEPALQWLAGISNPHGLTVLDLVSAASFPPVVQSKRGVEVCFIDGKQFASAQFDTLWQFMVDGAEMV